MNLGANFMSYLTKIALMLAIISLPQASFAMSPCNSRLIGIDIVAGTFNPPAYISPDTQSLKPAGKWPANLIEQGWHNLRKATCPLRIECEYMNGTKETIILPEAIDTCILRPGLTVTCE
jgi:hypothetical protein